MGSIRIVEADEIDWQPVSEAVAPETAARMSAAERDAAVRILHRGEGGTLQLFEVAFKPNEVVSPHAHASDEIIYVLEGLLILGRKQLGPGASVHVDANTLYGFSAGPQGLRFINFRGSANTRSGLKNNHGLAESDFRAVRGATSVVYYR